MIYISHRKNTIKELRNVDFDHGVEIDIRSNGNKLILHHDPFKCGVPLDEWLCHYKHKLLVLNIKEEGLERGVEKLLKSKNINNYFFLDQSFPFLIKFVKSGNKKTALRFSEYESIETILSLSGKVEWVWLDSFEYFSLDHNKYNMLKNNSFKLCLVSPELQGRLEDRYIEDLSDYLLTNGIVLDAICTKKIEKWKELNA